MADWSDALRGGLALQDAFAGLVAGLGAEAGMLVRTALSDFRPSRVATWDRLSQHSPWPLAKSFADGTFGSAFVRPKPASLWLATRNDLAEVERDPALPAWQERRGLRETAVLVLSGGPASRDHIELHFRAPFDETRIAMFEMILPTMARTWSARQVGLVTRCVVNHRQEIAAPAALPILSSTNPARLSRAEFRVCLLLGRGLSAQAAAEELNVSEATVRSHLRSIYAKTGTTGLAELVYRLLRSGRTFTAQDLRYA
ncbi:MAG: helix-turn-helix transcriptional regulator [Rhodobacteraceae bacterium]|nr:helix-turn-helix transcriptional regulator [Paracoccaceae bacterium]